MIAKVRAALAKFDALSLRERLLILTTVVVTIALPVLLYLIEPAQKAQVRLNTNVAKLKAEQAQATLELATLKAQGRQDPNQALLAQVEKLRAELDELNLELQSRSAALVAPTQMLELLEQVLAAQQGLTLVALEKGAPQRFLTAGAEAESERAGVYRHDLTLVVEGSFFNVQSYLQALEQLPQSFFWDELDYHVDSYPKARVTLRVHTLSTTEGWLGV